MVRRLQKPSGDSGSDDTDRFADVGEPVDGQHAVAHQLGSGSREGRKHQSGAVREEEPRAELQRLEVFRLTGRRGHPRLLRGDERVHRGRLADVRVAHHSYAHAAVAAPEPRAFARRLLRPALQHLEELFAGQDVLPGARSAAQRDGFELLLGSRRVGVGTRIVFVGVVSAFVAGQPSQVVRQVPERRRPLRLLRGPSFLHPRRLRVHRLRRGLGGPPQVADSSLIKVIAPRPAKLRREQVRLVEEQQRSLGGVDLGDVRLEVGAPVEQRVPRVHHLHHDVGPLAHAPQLSPNLEVLLEGRERQALVLLDRGERAAPLEEGGLLVAVQLVDGHVLGPRRAPGNLERVGVQGLRVGSSLGLRGGVRRGVRILGDAIGDAGRVAAAGHGQHPGLGPFGGEIPVGEIGEGEELVHVVALHDGREVRAPASAAASVGVRVGGVPPRVAGAVVDVARLRDVPDVSAVPLRALGQRAAEALALQPLPRVACPAHVPIRARVRRRWRPGM